LSFNRLAEESCSRTNTTRRWCRRVCADLEYYKWSSLPHGR